MSTLKFPLEKMKKWIDIPELIKFRDTYKANNIFKQGKLLEQRSRGNWDELTHVYLFVITDDAKPYFVLIELYEGSCSGCRVGIVPKNDEFVDYIIQRMYVSESKKELEDYIRMWLEGKCDSKDWW